MDASSLNQQLIDGLRGQGVLKDPRVAEALGACPRHLFVPGASLEAAYANRVVVLREGDDGEQPASTVSQPTVVVWMLQLLAAAPGETVLEIGTGSGWNAVLIGHMVGPGGTVHTVDQYADLVDQASGRLADRNQVHAHASDGVHGWAAGAPYDGLMSTAAVRYLPVAWRDQLAEGGRLVAPVAIGAWHFQVLCHLERRGDRLIGRVLSPVRFLPLHGAYDAPTAHSGDLVIHGDDARPVAALLATAPTVLPLEVVPLRLIGRLTAEIALAGSHVAMQGPPAAFPFPMRYPHPGSPLGHTEGLRVGGGVAWLARRPGSPPEATRDPDADVPLAVISYGDPAAAEVLLEATATARRRTGPPRLTVEADFAPGAPFATPRLIESA